jgi:hypothetical protein
MFGFSCSLHPTFPLPNLRAGAICGRGNFGGLRHHLRCPTTVECCNFSSPTFVFARVRSYPKHLEHPDPKLPHVIPEEPLFKIKITSITEMQRIGPSGGADILKGMLRGQC